MASMRNGEPDSSERRDLGWCVVELLGHRRLGARVATEEIAGFNYLRLDIPDPKQGGAYALSIDGAGIGATQFVNPSSVYALTPTTMDIAIAAAASATMPFTRWELRTTRSALADYAGSPDDFASADDEIDSDDFSDRDDRTQTSRDVDRASLQRGRDGQERM
jgi:hypothetical protein